MHPEVMEDMRSKRNAESIAKFLMDSARFSERKARQCSSKLVEHGFESISAMESRLRSEDLIEMSSFEGREASKIMKAVESLRRKSNKNGSAVAPSRRREPIASRADAKDCDDLMLQNTEAKGVEEDVGVKERRYYTVMPLDRRQAQQHCKHTKKVHESGACWRNKINSLAKSEYKVSEDAVIAQKKSHRRASAIEMPRPESAPPPRNDIISQQPRRKSVAGIIMRERPATSSTPRRHDANYNKQYHEENDECVPPAECGIPYQLSETGVLRVGGFVIGPDGEESLLTLRNELVPLDELGRGAGGCVQRALHTPSGIIVAVKRMAIENDSRRHQMVLELKALHGLKGASAPLARIQHGIKKNECKDIHDDQVNTPAAAAAKPGSKYVVDFFDTYVDQASSTLCLVLEFMDGGSLNDLRQKSLEEGIPIDERLLSRVAFCVLSALAYIHSRRELHRDLKPSNILVNLRGEIKVSDYGCHRQLDDGNSLASTFTGTIAYMSPERVAGDNYSYASDIWSLGVSLLATATGHNPYAKHKVYWDVAHAIQRNPVPTLNDRHFSHDFKDFIHQCLQKEPALRPSAAELLQHPFARAGRRVGIGPLVARAAPPVSTDSLTSLATALCDAHNLTVDTELMNKISAQLGVASDSLIRAYDEVRANRLASPVHSTRVIFPQHKDDLSVTILPSNEEHGEYIESNRHFRMDFSSLLSEKRTPSRLFEHSGDGHLSRFIQQQQQQQQRQDDDFLQATYDSINSSVGTAA